MQRSVQSWVRWGFRWAGIFILFFCIFYGGQYSSWNKERLYHKLLSGSLEEKRDAAIHLAVLRGEQQLVRALRSDSNATRKFAEHALWYIWSRAAGEQAFHYTRLAQRARGQKQYIEALQILTLVVEKYPRYSEGWNQRAHLYWQLGFYEKAVVDCKKALALNPSHYGAWQNLALCLVPLGDLDGAAHALRMALNLMPHDSNLRGLLQQCQELRLHLPNPRSEPYDLV